MPKPPAVVPRNTTAPVREVEAVLSYVPVWVRLVMLLAWDCGLRIGTAVSVRPRDLTDGNLQTRTKKGNYTNTPASPRVLALAQAAASMGSPDEPMVRLLGCKQSTVYLRSQAARKHISRAQAALGLQGRWTPHDLRRSAAREMYNRTRDLRKAQALLGHRALAQTAWYLQDALHTLAPEDLRQPPGMNRQGAAERNTPTPSETAEGEETEKP